MWYGIPTFPGYRIDHLGEVMSLKGDSPRIMKTWEIGGQRHVMLRQNGKYVNCTITELLELAGLHLSEEPVEKSQQTHHEAIRERCDAGHEFTPENTMWRKGRGGRRHRQCKRCHAIYMARYRAKKKARDARALPATAPGCRPH